MQILSCGNPNARLMPEAQPRTSAGAAEGMATMSLDFDEPMDLRWDALK